MEIVEWHDCEGWTEDLKLWILAWIEVCLEHSNSVAEPTLTESQSSD